MPTASSLASERATTRPAVDRSADGRYIVAVKTTGIYCLPSCRPPRLPKPENTVIYATPEEARAAGYRACKLCHPDRVAHDRA